MTESLLLVAFNATHETMMENDRALLKLCETMINQIQDMQHEINVLKEQMKLVRHELFNEKPV